MIRKPSDTKAVGLHLDGLLLKLAEVDTVRGKIKVKRLEEFPLLQKEGHLHFRQEGEDRICHELTDKSLTVANLEGKETAVRKMRIKLTREKDIEAAFGFEAESYLPYPQVEALIDKIVVEKDKEATELTLIACKKEALQQYLSRFADLKLDPETVTCTPAALAAFAERYTHIEGVLVVVYIGEAASLSAIVKEGKLISSHSLPIGTSSLCHAYEQDQAAKGDLLATPFQNLDFTQLDLATTPQLKQALQTFKHDLSWMVLSEIKSIRLFEQEVPPLLTLGEGAILKGLEGQLYQEIPYQRVEIATQEGMELNQNLLSKFAIAIGSALSAMPHYPHPINLRQGELAYAEPWKRFKGALYLFAASSFFLALLILLFGFAYLGYREDLLREKYGKTLAEMHKSYPLFEREYHMQTSKKGEVTESLLPLKDLSLNGIDARLNVLQKQIQSQPDLFPLFPNLPLVSDTLAWLSNHPFMKSSEGAIKIESFNYQMVKRPEMTKKNEKYQVKVDLEISAPTQKMAREFHNALITPNDFIDPKAEVKWSASRGKYQTSFYLKDKTTYLPVNK